ncbi:MAG: hypothetical protein ACFFD4_14805 [Candidatus Odinarchaeota archaeon]
MSLNWSTWVYVASISLIPLLAANIMVFREYRRTKFLHSLYMLLAWFFVLLWCVIGIVGILLLDRFLIILTLLIWIPIGFFLILLVDSVSRESIDPFKFLIMGILSASMVISLADPQSIASSTFITGETMIIPQGFALLTLAAILIYVSGIYLYFTLKIHLNAPNSLKFYSKINVVGAAVMGIINAIFEGIGVNYVIPGLVTFLVAMGAITLTIMFVKEPRLAFILPFKALKLTVVDKSGLPLFNYSWNPSEDIIDESLFSGMLQAVSSFVAESVKKGAIREIHLEDAIILFKPSNDFSFVSVLLTTRSSRSLRSALATFTNKFMHRFSDVLQLPVNTENFEPAKEIVFETFSFIPEYD